MFNFDIRHVLGKRYIATNEFFRRSRELSNNIDEIYEKNIDDFINDQFNYMRVCLMQVNEKNDEQSLKNEYFEKFQRIIYYLITLAKLNYLD